jgi:hypothetical protein
MPLRKYLIVKRAAEINEIELRMQTISDINSAFSGNNDHINNLMKIRSLIVGHDQINWAKDKDASERMRRWAR